MSRSFWARAGHKVFVTQLGLGFGWPHCPRSRPTCLVESSGFVLSTCPPNACLCWAHTPTMSLVRRGVFSFFFFFFLITNRNKSRLQDNKNKHNITQRCASIMRAQGIPTMGWLRFRLKSQLPMKLNHSCANFNHRGGSLEAKCYGLIKVVATIFQICTEHEASCLCWASLCYSYANAHYRVKYGPFEIWSKLFLFLFDLNLRSME